MDSPSKITLDNKLAALSVDTNDNSQLHKFSNLFLTSGPGPHVETNESYV